MLSGFQTASYGKSHISIGGACFLMRPVRVKNKCRRTSLGRGPAPPPPTHQATTSFGLPASETVSSFIFSLSDVTRGFTATPVRQAERRGGRTGWVEELTAKSTGRESCSGTVVCCHRPSSLSGNTPKRLNCKWGGPPVGGLTSTTVRWGLGRLARSEPRPSVALVT